MEFIDLARNNEESGRWIYTSYKYNESTNSFCYTAFDTLKKKYIMYVEDEFDLCCPFCGQKNNNGTMKRLHIRKHHQERIIRTNPDIEEIVLAELKRFLDPTSIDSILDDGIKNINVVGDVQSGKSTLMMLIVWLMIYKKKINPIIFVANMVNSYNQILIRDLPLFNRWLRAKGENQKTLKIHGLRKEGVHDQRGVTLCMGNISQMKKIVHEGAFCVIADESDTFIKHADPSRDHSCSGHLFTRIIQSSVKNFFITATPFANLNQKNISSCSIKMNSSELYRGISSPKITKHFIEDKKKLLKDDDELVELTLDAMNICNVEGEMNYSSILINARSTKEKHKKLALLLQRRGIASFVINSEHNKPITHYRADGIIQVMDIHTVQNLYDYFEFHSDSYKCHVIISNRMANRAISFRPSFPKRGGLIGEILIPCDSSHCSFKIQCLRICGNYGEDYPQQHLWICKSDFTDIESEYKNINQVWIPSNREYGPSRFQIEDREIFYTHKHDRGAVDDTKYCDKFSICDKLFETRGHVLDFLGADYGHTTSMTGQRITIQNIPDLDQVSAHRPASQARVREFIKMKLRDEYHLNVGNDGLNIAWDFKGDRWRQLHNIKTRFFGPNIRYCSKYVGSVNEDYTAINIVVWNDGYFEDDRIESRTLGDDLFDAQGTAFLYQTTDGEWKFYNGSEDRKMGILKHV